MVENMYLIIILMIVIVTNSQLVKKFCVFVPEVLQVPDYFQQLDYFRLKYLVVFDHWHEIHQSLGPRLGRKIEGFRPEGHYGTVSRSILV